MKCPGDVLGSLVTGLLSCSPAEVLSVPGNKVNNPNIVEEDKYSISHLPKAITKLQAQRSDFPPSELLLEPTRVSTLRTWPPPVLALSGEGLWAAHTAALGWADSPSFFFFLLGWGRAGSRVL